MSPLLLLFPQNISGAGKALEVIPARTQYPGFFSEREARGPGLLGTIGEETCIVVWPESPSGRRQT